MDSPGFQKKIARFGLFRVDLEERVLTRKGVRDKLQEKPFQILALLLEHSGEIVTREDLKTALWRSNTFVEFDDGLNTAIKKPVALDDCQCRANRRATLGRNDISPIVGSTLAVLS
jgi:DNA-binding response OmpR family regulator